MRLPRVRLTVRGLMVAVATLGITLGVFVERRERFQRERDRHAPGMITTVHGRVYDYFGHEVLDERLYATEVRYHVHMFHKYDSAFRYPWLPVRPDPPAPLLSPRGYHDPSNDQSRSQ